MTAAGRLLGIQPGETGLAAALALLMLATAAGAAMGGTATEALLFARFDLARLPLLYVALGLVTFACTLVVSGLLARANRARLYALLPAGLALALVGERIAALSGNEWVYAALWLAMNVTVTLQGIVIWGLAAAVCDMRQAKRLFPLFNAGKIGGTVLGSFATTALVRVVRVEELLLVWAASLGLACLIALRLRGRVKGDAPEEAPGGLIGEMRRGFAVVRESSLLRLLAAALVLFSLLYFALALPFTRGARAAYPDETELASFLGLFNGATTLAALVLSLFVANRLYARIGVVMSIVALGAVYLAGFAAIAVSGGLAVLVVSRFAQLTWLSGVADTAYQTLFNPVPPERRDQIRAFMEGVPGQAGIALAGILLLAGDASFDSRAVAIGGVAASALTVALLLRARAAYSRALADSLRVARPQPFLPEADPFGALRRDADALAVVLEGLTGSDVAVRRASAGVLRELRAPESRGSLVRALDDVDAEVRAIAVAALSALGEIDALARFADDPDPRIRAAIAVAADAGAARLLTDSDPDVRVAALDALAARGAATGSAPVAACLADASAPVRRAAIAAVLACRPAGAAAALMPLLEDPDPTVAGAALAAVAGLAPLPVTPLEELLRRETAATLPDLESLRALGVAHGEAETLLRDALRDRARGHAVRAVRAGLALAGGDGPDLVVESLESRDPSRRAGALELLEALERREVRPLLALWESSAPQRQTAEHATLERLAETDADELVRATALRERGGATVETLPTLPLMERVLFLRKVPLFGGLSPADLKHVAALAREEVHLDGATLGREGETGDHLYVILSGVVRVLAGLEEREIARRAAGDVVGEMAVIVDMPRIATLRCVGETRALRLGRRDFEAIVRDRPSVALGVIQVLCTRLAEAQATSAAALR